MDDLAAALQLSSRCRSDDDGQRQVVDGGGEQLDAGIVDRVP
jgi:hypothetical protein